jgi:hypothetical protein
MVCPMVRKGLIRALGIGLGVEFDKGSGYGYGLTLFVLTPEFRDFRREIFELVSSPFYGVDAAAEVC